MKQITILLALFITIAFLYTCTNIEGYRRMRRGGHVRHGHRHGRWWGRHGGRFGGWGYWGRPYYSGIYTHWPPYLYDQEYHTPRCTPVNKASDCDPFRPVKVGTDSDGDGDKDAYKCCRRY